MWPGSRLVVLSSTSCPVSLCEEPGIVLLPEFQVTVRLQLLMLMGLAPGTCRGLVPAHMGHQECPQEWLPPAREQRTPQNTVSEFISFSSHSSLLKIVGSPMDFGKDSAIHLGLVFSEVVSAHEKLVEKILFSSIGNIWPE